MIPAREALEAAVDTVLPAVLVVALHLFLVGHDEPGGGFAAGLLVAGALSLRAITHPSDEKPLLAPELLLGSGLLLVAGIASVPLLAGSELLAASSWTFALPALGKVKVSTVLLFDLGVLLVVVGLAQSVLGRVREVLR